MNLQENSSTRRPLRISFCLMVAMLAVFQFSENTADPDLWGHIVFGRQILATGIIPKTEMYSWTARGQPWINHEWLAEVALGWAHQEWGGGGVLALKMAVGLLTFALCLRLGGANIPWPMRFVTWALGALAVVEISYGFAARPQIFTALFLACELMLLRRIHNGSRRWAFALPILFLVWINTHGGALAGFALLVLATIATTAQSVRRHELRGIVCVLWLAVAASLAALMCNPWRGELLRWLIGSVLWMRPEIQEWNPTPWGWDHAALFFLIGLAVFAWLFSRRPKVWWEGAACAAFALLGLRAERNAPLCAIVLLALVPWHLVDALGRFRGAVASWEAAFSIPAMQKGLAVVCCFGTLGAGIGTLALHKEHPLTMEAPRSQYPVGAMEFLRKHDLQGRLLVFFDWGEMAIFELPRCPVSIDGRLDTCYSRQLISAHWNLYNGDAVNQNILDIDAADLALLPRNLAGTAALAKRPGWRVVYYDELSAILARQAERFSGLDKLEMPVTGLPQITQGRSILPNSGPRWNSPETRPL